MSRQLAEVPLATPPPRRLAGRPAGSRPRLWWSWLRGALLTLALLGASAVVSTSLAGPLTPAWTGLALLAALFLVSALPVLALRWVRPPTSAFMIWTRRGRPAGETSIDHEWVPYDAVSRSMRLAVIAAEDAHFVSHAGFDWPSIRQAVRYNREGGPRRGASTITQQVAKNLFLWARRSYVRKAVEAYFTVLIEAMWPKRRILEVYLNIAQFGPNVFGAGAASRVLLGKDVSGLRLQDAALLAAALPSPGRYDVRDPPPAMRLRQVLIMGKVRRLDVDPDRLVIPARPAREERR